MMNPENYDYEDVIFQLELNLQAVRRELIDLLEEHTHDCIHCKRLKCNCIKNAQERNSFFSLFHYNMKSVSTNNTILRIPPPAYTLPKPEWTKVNNAVDNTQSRVETKSCIRNTKSNGNHSKFEPISIEENCIWPQFPKSIWSVDLKVNNERDHSDDESVSSVQSFFRYFSHKNKM